MKTRKIWLFSFSLFIIVLTGVNDLSGQEIDKTYRWNYEVNADSRLVLDNYDTDMEIHTWNKPEIEFHMIIDAEFRDKEDAAAVDSFLGNLKFDSNPAKTEINAKFWKSRANIMGFSTMVLEGMKTIRYKKFKMECIVYMPDQASLELNTKYSEINIEDIGGELSLDSHDDEIFAGSVGEKSSLTAKYSELEFTSLKDIDLDLYDCELSVEDAGDMKILTKYSDINAGGAGILNIDSYDDDLVFENCSDIHFIAKYSDFTTGRAGKLVADTYECEFSADLVSTARIESRYSDFEISVADSYDIISFYEGSIESEMVKSVEILETKYGEYTIEELAKEFKVKDSYEDNIVIERLGTGLQSLEINGKYLDIQLGIAFNFDCRLIANIKYPDLDIDEDVFKTKIHIKESSDLEYEGIKGTEKAGMPELHISGYEVNLSISEY